MNIKINPLSDNREELSAFEVWDGTKYLGMIVRRKHERKDYWATSVNAVMPWDEWTYRFKSEEEAIKALKLRAGR